MTIPTSRSEAALIGAVVYISETPCPRGHVGERYTSSYSCVQCIKLKVPERSEQLKKRRAEDPAFREFELKKNRDRYHNNAEFREERLKYNATYRAEKLKKDAAFLARQKAYFKQYNADPVNKARQNEYRRGWLERNRARTNAQASARRARQKNATPEWLTREMMDEIDAIFTTATELSAVTGEPHEVDHCIPLDGKQVCGLHVPWNLRVMERGPNRSKQARLPTDPTDWCAWPHALDQAHHQVAASPVS